MSINLYNVKLKKIMNKLSRV